MAGEHAVMDRDGLELFAACIEANVANTAAVTNRIQELNELTIRELRATIRAMRATVYELTSQPYAPNPIYVQEAMWPGKEMVESFMPEGAYDCNHQFDTLYNMNREW